MVGKVWDSTNEAWVDAWTVFNGIIIKGLNISEVIGGFHYVNSISAQNYTFTVNGNYYRYARTTEQTGGYYLINVPVDLTKYSTVELKYRNFSRTSPHASIGLVATSTYDRQGSDLKYASMPYNTVTSSEIFQMDISNINQQAYIGFSVNDGIGSYDIEYFKLV